jgi:hypothetical protein
VSVCRLAGCGGWRRRRTSGSSGEGTVHVCAPQRSRPSSPGRKSVVRPGCSTGCRYFFGHRQPGHRPHADRPGLSAALAKATISITSSHVWPREAHNPPKATSFQRLPLSAEPIWRPPEPSCLLEVVGNRGRGRLRRGQADPSASAGRLRKQALLSSRSVLPRVGRPAGRAQPMALATQRDCHLDGFIKAGSPDTERAKWRSGSSPRPSPDERATGRLA